MITRAAGAAQLTISAVNDRPKRLHDFVVEQIGAQIVAGQLRPGELLASEQSMAEDFRVSRTVLREGLSKLRDKGLIEIRHGTGIKVTPAAKWDLLDARVLWWLACAPASNPHAADLYTAALEFAEAVLPAATRLTGNPLSACLLQRLRDGGYGQRHANNGGAHHEGER